MLPFSMEQYHFVNLSHSLIDGKTVDSLFGVMQEVKRAVTHYLPELFF